MVKIEIYLNEEENEVLSNAIEKSEHVTYSSFAMDALMKEATRLVSFTNKELKAGEKK